MEIFVARMKDLPLTEPSAGKENVGSLVSALKLIAHGARQLFHIPQRRGYI
jgi:hypothetical protein